MKRKQNFRHHENQNNHNPYSAIKTLKHAMKEAANPKVSRFSQWDTNHLKQLLVENNVQIRGSANASRETLIRICDEVFGPFDEEEEVYEDDYYYYNEEGDEEGNGEENDGARSRERTGLSLNSSFTFEELTRMNWAALKIQRLFIASRKRMYEKMYAQNQHYYYDKQHQENYQDEEYQYHYDELPHPSATIMEEEEERHNKHEPMHQVSLYENHQESSVEENQSSSVVKRGYVNNQHSSYDDDISSNESFDELDEELDTAWRKPSWKFAKRYEAENRPHKSGKAMERYNWKTVTLGRHCTMGGCGEQLDLWNEGATSEFSQFGSGITNYFKFLKWCSWIMFILSIIHIPAVVINILAASSGTEYESTLAMTTLGNLGNAKDVNFITITGCDEDAYQFDACTLKKNHLALFYAFLDSVGTIIVIIGWVWLRGFEEQEVDNLNRSTVDASDYTIRVLGIPSKAKERELAVHFANITNEAVAEVNLAFKSAKAIQFYYNRGKIMKDRIKCIQRIRYEKINHTVKESKGRKNKRIRKLLDERNKLTTQITLVDDKRKDNVDSNTDAIQAFVTFETESGFLKAVSEHQVNWFRSFCCYPRRLKFKHGRLKLSQAPEPSTIIWENLEFSSTSRFSRKCLTTFVASLAMLMSIYFTFLAKDFREELMKSMSSVCPDYSSELTKEELNDMAEQNNSLSHCYCSTLEPKEQWDEPMCIEYVRGALKASAMNYGAGFMVCFMNMFFTILMDKAGSFEKHESIDAMESSNMTRVFLLKFLNTGCLVLLYNMTFIQTIVGVRYEDPHNFNVEWFETGGVSMIIVMCINVISPHIGPLIQYRKYRGNINSLEQKGLTKDKETDDKYKIWYTQEELNAVYLGPPFSLNYRYTQSLVNFFICWMYSISMPVLPFIGAFSFYLSYWVDKFLFCNFYRIPPKYSDNIGSRSSSLIGYSIILHIFMSCWILGSNQIFAGEQIISGNAFVVSNPITRIMLKTHVVPMELLGVAFISSLIMRRSLMTFTQTLSQILRCLTCRSGSNVRELKKVMNTVQVAYSAARLRGVIKGLASYNILQNPKYQEAFAISPEFAMSHHRLKSIRGYNTKEGGLCFSHSSENSSIEP